MFCTRHWTTKICSHNSADHFGPFPFSIQHSSGSWPFYPRLPWPVEHSALAIPASPQPWTDSQRAWGLGTRPMKARGWQSGKKKKKKCFSWGESCPPPTQRPRPFPTYRYKQAPTSLCSFGQFRKRCLIWMEPGLSKKAGAGFHPTWPLHLWP